MSSHQSEKSDAGQGVETVSEQLLDLNDLRIFTYVAVLCSFSAAAEELRTSKSSVSRSISRLERLLKTDLLQRTTRKVKLTRAGSALRDRGTEILQRVSDSIFHVKELKAAPTGPLVVHVSSDAGLADHLYKIVLPQLLERYDSAQFVVRVASERSVLLGAEVDVALFPGPTPPPGAARIAQLTRGLVARSDYDSARAPAAFINRLEVEPLSLEANGLTGYEGVVRVAGNDDHGIRELVLAGLGVGVLPLHFCTAHFAAGTLRHVHTEIKFPPLALYLTYPSRRQLAPIVRAFVEALQTSLKGDGGATFEENHDGDEGQDLDDDEGHREGQDILD
ncbi:LysR family transcriptional regulator [Variovorax sp. J22G73]|uniref:LysR family transcriptional regulator n=1 Tax=unclassified Variovorax TaxID=663243 RepID=UPI002576607A|nr:MULTISPECIES: LysR family transcriptional regulator [unclassified Variovorax]MDM0004430.1 LysR family transcriptional regulator [Variovorax sp. J22R203]MDM0095904.1 LysR family transcriptional regulator [Variovorax sp. J22G73]